MSGIWSTFSLKGDNVQHIPKIAVIITVPFFLVLCQGNPLYVPAFILAIPIALGASIMVSVFLFLVVTPITIALNYYHRLCLISMIGLVSCASVLIVSVESYFDIYLFKYFFHTHDDSLSELISYVLTITTFITTVYWGFVYSQASNISSTSETEKILIKKYAFRHSMTAEDVLKNIKSRKLDGQASWENQNWYIYINKKTGDNESFLNQDYLSYRNDLFVNHKLGRYKDVSKTFDVLSSSAPQALDDKEIILLMSNTYCNLNDFARAREILANFVTKNPEFEFDSDILNSYEYIELESNF